MGASPWKDQPLVEEGPNVAANYIEWKDAVEFCKKLTEKEGVEYRLPTESEWEYACRAGTTTAFSFGDDRDQIGEYAWFKGNAYAEGEQYAHTVGQKLPNAWALYDMHGNVWEWCHDWFGPYPRDTDQVTDPKGPKKGRVRVWRGGGFSDPADLMRSANRLSYNQHGYRPIYITGFRVVRMLTQ
ncbi:MAG: hypothetical protein CMJ78_12355 [Planctomycetaceae bacterium]|nr:hypothetical protein [Planctomycetaceae bacterium]